MRKYLAEFLGTFVLVFGGVGSAVLAGSHIGYAGVAFAFGLSLLAMVYTIGPISGCHINPAVTLGVLLAKRIGSRDAVMYVVAQIFGAIVASALILLIASSVAGGYDLAAGYPAVHAWLQRIAEIPGWKAPYELMPGARLQRYV